MRYILTALLITTFTNINAQATDFTLTDIDGTTHNLYTYLNEGKTVVLNFSTSDCGECWNFHETRNMNTANTLYGAGGTDEMVFLLLEIDSLSGLEELEGMGLNTAGNWLSETDFPIIDNAQDVAAEYGISNVPTVIAVCADTTTSDLYTAGYPSPQSMYIAHNACTPASINNDLSIIDITNETSCGTLHPELILMNTGADTVNAAQIQFTSDIQIDTADWTGTLAPDEYAELTFSTSIMEATNITATILSTNGTADGSSFTKNLELAPLQFAEQIIITIQTDGFGCETQWDFFDATDPEPPHLLTAGNINATAGNRVVEYDADTGECGIVGYSNNTEFVASFPASDTLLIPPGCYVFHIVDDWGDGICCAFGEGSYTITNQDGTILASGGDFGAEERVILNIANPVTVDIQEPIDKNTLRVFPNPAQDNFNISFNLNESSELSLSMYNALGKEVQYLGEQTYLSGQNNIQMDTRNLPSGLYFVTLHTEAGALSKRITIAKP